MASTQCRNRHQANQGAVARPFSQRPEMQIRQAEVRPKGVPKGSDTRQRRWTVHPQQRWSRTHDTRGQCECKCLKMSNVESRVPSVKYRMRRCQGRWPSRRWPAVLACATPHFVLSSQVARFELHAVSSPTIQFIPVSPSSNLGPIIQFPNWHHRHRYRHRHCHFVVLPQFPPLDMDMGRGRHAYYSPLAIAAALAIPDQICLTYSSVICKAQASSPVSSRHLTSTVAHVSSPVLRNSLHCSANSVYFLLLFPST